MEEMEHPAGAAGGGRVAPPNGSASEAARNDHHVHRVPDAVGQADAILDGSCFVCGQPLFSVGKRVVVLDNPGCGHHFHEDCLNRQVTQVRQRTGGERSACPQCHEPLGMLRDASFEIPWDGTPAGFVLQGGRTTAMAKKMVQALLWSDIATNTEAILKCIRCNFLPEAAFHSRLGLVRESGMVLAVLRTIETFPNDGYVQLQAVQCLQEFLHVGSCRGIGLSLLGVENVHNLLLRNVACSGYGKLVKTTVSLLRVLAETDECCEKMLAWPRSLVRQVLAAIKTYVDQNESESLLKECCLLLRDLSTHENCLRDMVEYEGGVLSLYRVQTIYGERCTAAHELLEHILSQDLALA